MLNRRHLLGATIALPWLGRGVARAQGETTIRMGSLKLIHSIAPYFYDRFTPTGVKMEVIPFESPTECKNAVVTKSVDFGTFGIAAALLGAAAGEPVVVIASTCNRGMAVIAKAGSPVASIPDLRGKRVAIWPGSTQEVFFLERLRMEGMTIRDITPVRVSFSEMHIALARGDIDAYVGAEPGPGLSLATGVGKLVEYPYGTEMGSLNMVFCAHRDTLTQKPDLTRTMLGIHRRASEFAAANPTETAAMTVARLGQRRDAVDASLSNVEFTWRFGPEQAQRSRAYADHMLALKQIRRLPDFATFIDTRFVTAQEAA